MTEERFEIRDPYRCYAFMVLLFDCHDCRRVFSGDPPYPVNADWQWFHDAAEQAWRSGWYVAPNLPDGSSPLYCLCPQCAARRELHPPDSRE